MLSLLLINFDSFCGFWCAKENYEKLILFDGYFEVKLMIFSDHRGSLAALASVSMPTL